MPRRRWLIACLLAFGVVVNYFDRVNLSVAKQALENDFGISNVTFGYLLSAYSWTYAALQLPSGVLLDRFGVQIVMRASALLWSIACFAGALSPGLNTLFASRFLLGIGEAPTFPANAKATGQWFPRSERSLATAIFDSAAKFSTGIGTPLIGLVLIGFGWRFSFAMTGAISFVFFLVFFLVYRDPADASAISAAAERSGAPLGYLIRQRKVLGLTLGFAAYNYCFYLFLTWLPSYFSGALHVALKTSVLYSSIPWLVATGTDLLVGGWLVDSLVKRSSNESRVRQTILTGGMVLGLAVLGLIFVRSAAAAIVCITISIGGLAASAPVAWSAPSLIAPRASVGRIGGIMNFGSQIAAITAPIATGYLIGPSNNFSQAFLAAAIALILGIGGYAFLLGRIEQIPEPDRQA